jgi:hypothetical protein
MSAATDQQPRIFTKKVGGQTKTRTVHSESDAVAARFDGFTEDEKPSKATQAAAAKSGSGSSANAANNAG